MIWRVGAKKRIYFVMCIITLTVTTFIWTPYNASTVAQGSSECSKEVYVDISIGGKCIDRIVTKISQKELQHLVDDIEKIKEDGTLSPVKKVDMILKLLRDRGILPSTATFENLTKTATTLRDILIGEKYTPFISQMESLPNQKNLQSEMPSEDIFYTNGDDVLPIGPAFHVGFLASTIMISISHQITPICLEFTTLKKNHSQYNYTIPFLGKEVNMSFVLSYGFLIGEAFHSSGNLLTLYLSVLPLAGKPFAIYFNSPAWLFAIGNAPISLTIYSPSYTPPLYFLDIVACVSGLSALAVGRVDWPG